MSDGANESISSVDENCGEKREFLESSAFFVISAWEGPRGFRSGRKSAVRALFSMIKLRMD